jgi:hypothetical protein
MRRSFLLRLAAIAGALGVCLAATGDAKAGSFHRHRDRPGIVRRAGEFLRVILPPYGERPRARSCCD